MKWLCAIMLPMLLAGCVTTATPVKRSFPAVPAEFMEPAPELKELRPDTQDLDALIINANNNYSLYREVESRLEDWQQWYQEQKKIFDSVK